MRQKRIVGWACCVVVVLMISFAIEWYTIEQSGLPSEIDIANIAKAIKYPHGKEERFVAAELANCRCLLWCFFESRKAGKMSGCVATAYFPEEKVWLIVSLTGSRRKGAWTWNQGGVVGGPPTRIVLKRPPRASDVRLMTDHPEEYWWDHDFATGFGLNESAWRELADGDDLPKFAKGMRMRALITKWQYRLGIARPPN